MREDERIAKVRHMEMLIQKYVDACNEADIEKTISCFTPDAVHYFPPGMYGGPFVGAGTIAKKWKEAVDTLGSYWTMNQILTDPEKDAAVIEWTHFKTKQGKILRGAEWYLFDKETGLIKEIRAYYASPQAPDLDRLELGAFDYAGRGYPLAPPSGARG